MLNFSEEYQNKLHAAWEKFIDFKESELDLSFMRPEILESWKRSRAHKITDVDGISNVLSPEMLNIRINANISLIELVHPYMEKLYSVVEGSGFYILFCDKEGYILDLIGDPEIIEHGRNYSMLVVGANRKEEVVGTNAIGTCMAAKVPIQIWSEEHYMKRHKDYVCSSAPFFDSSGNIMGCLAITGRAASVHSHTLGMVICAVDGITKELNIKSAYNDIELISAQRNSIIQSVTSGLLLLNASGLVIQINDIALRLLGLKYENILGKNLFKFISFEEKRSISSNLTFIDKEFFNQDTNVYSLVSNIPPQRFNISVTFVRDSTDKINGTVICLNEPKLINKLVNNISGYKSKYTFDSIHGKSPAVKNLITIAKHAAESDSNVLILGESGTGKELLAHAMHNASNFSQGPFVAINCAALPRGLVESELFGYEKGAFTGASKDGNPGKFELAEGGTIFLDEIGDMPLEVQISLLRVIQSKEILRIGGKFPKKISVRIIAATNRNLCEAIASKTFREDLYYRLNVFTINVPPLSAREDDVRMLADEFVKNYNAINGKEICIAPEVYPLLMSYSWPGNIRQLENILERAVNITNTSRVESHHLPEEILLCNVAPSVVSPSSPKKGKELIEDALAKTNGNVTQAAILLGVSRRTLYRKIDKYRIARSDSQ